MGISEDNIIIAEDGDIIKMNANKCRIAGNLDPQTIYIDGIGMGNIEDVVLRDRRMLSGNGIIFIVVGVDYGKKAILYEPDFIIKGVVYIKDLSEIIDKLRNIIKNTIKNCFSENIIDKNMIEAIVNDRVGKFVFKKAGIRPIIITKVAGLYKN
jgi:mRNA degradation ribonuclease J1/J2